jgi:hypothetical protein
LKAQAEATSTAEEIRRQRPLGVFDELQKLLFIGARIPMRRKPDERPADQFHPIGLLAIRCRHLTFSLARTSAGIIWLLRDK